jgi:hypothetical protein
MGGRIVSALKRPWLCPEPRCTPIHQLQDGDYDDISVPEPGQTWSCAGRMERPVTFMYDGVDHTNDCNSCHYTALKGVIRWQENAADWRALTNFYSRAVNALTALRGRDES